MTAALLAGPTGLSQQTVPEQPLTTIEEQPVAPSPTRVVDLPIDRAEYIVGPGDELLLTLSGEVNEAEHLTVSPEGALIVGSVGSLPVSGFTLEEAESELRGFFDEYYHGIDISLNLISPRDVVIHVTGAVAEPGHYEATAAMRVAAVVELAGGVIEDGSLRAVRLLVPGGDARRVDLLRYAYLGELAANPLVMEGAVIHVPFQLRTVEVRGAVNRPDEYELVASDDVLKLIRLAGGTAPDAELSNVELVRFSDENPRLYTRMLLDLTDASGDAAARAGNAQTRLEDGDRIFVRRLEGWHRDARVEVRGEVAMPGTYSVNEGEEGIRDVVSRAGGPTDAADLAGATLRRRASRGIDSGVQRQVELLEEYESVHMTYEEYAFFVSQRIELPDQVSVDIESLLSNGGEEDDVLLLDGDIIEIPRSLSVVRVSGAIQRPGFVNFTANASAKDYVALAGGFTSDANRRGLRIVKSQSGSRLRASRDVRIEPGDMVWIPRRPARDWWEITKEILTVVGQVATIYLVVDNIATQ